MKIILFIIFIYVPSLLNAQIITTVDSIGVGNINYVVFDTYGNLYFVNGLGNQIMKMDTNYITSVVAGTGSVGFSGDGGPATNAKLDVPDGITVDSIGNVYFADAYNQRIRKIDVATGIISTIAGTGIGGVGTGGFSGDSGPAIAAQLNVPAGICFDKTGNLYIADAQNYRIRKINTDGIITTIVGNGIESLTSGDNGPASAAECYPLDVLTDDTGNLYFSQPVSTIRKVNTLGIISTIAGDTSSDVYNGDGIPATSANIDPYCIAIGKDGLLYISDAANNNRIRVIDNSGIIHTIAGNGTLANTGDGGTDTAAEIDGPSGIAFDACGNLYIGQVEDSRIRKISFNPTCTLQNLKVPQVSQNEVLIYPTPSSEALHIDNTATESKYVLLNITGNMEQSGTLQAGNNTINISRLASGMYLLELRDDEGVRIVGKVVKE